MKTKKLNTLQSKLGFADEDLKKPSHDKMMLWLDKNISTIANALFSQDLTSGEVEELKSHAFNELKNVVNDRTRVIKHYISQSEYYEKKVSLDEDEKRFLKEWNEKIDMENRKLNYISNWTQFKVLPKKPEVIIHRKIWELPVTTQGQYQSGTSSKYTVGFIDMAVQLSISKPYVSGIISKREPHITGGNSDWIRDLRGEIAIDYEQENTWMYIEVKTEIPSLGELIRQINHYKEYQPGSYYVLCPENPYKHLLEEQRIGVIDYIE